MRKFMLLAIFWCGLYASAQQQGTVVDLGNATHEAPLDGYIVSSDIESRKVVPYAPIRQTDVAYRKRIWREVDFREKMNNPLVSEKANLVQIFIEAIKAGELTAYDPTPTTENPTGDNFEKMKPMSVEEVLAKLGGDSVLVEEYNEQGEVIASSYQARDFDIKQVIKIRIKEDWIFDKQRSVFEPRIVGIAPLFVPQIPGIGDDMIPVPVAPGDASDTADPFAVPADPFAAPADPFAPAPEPTPVQTETSTAGAETPLPPINTDGLGTGTMQIDPTPAFWIYFPEARHILVNKEVINRHNDATGLSFDDVFIKRIFSSYIIKQSNPEDLRVRDYISDDLARLYESEKIKKALTDYEQDLWSY